MPEPIKLFPMTTRHAAMRNRQGGLCGRCKANLYNHGSREVIEANGKLVHRDCDALRIRPGNRAALNSLLSDTKEPR